jgi:hypothetical protein
LDLSDVVLLGVVEDLQQVVWLVPDGEVFSLFRLEGVFGQEHWVVVGTAHVGLPVPLGIVEGVDELFESFEVIQYLRILRDEVVDLLCFCLNAVEFGDQTLLYLELIFHSSLCLFGLFLNAFDKLMHEFHVIFEVELPGLEGLFLVLDGIF